MSKGFFVTGTDTGVGKTVVTGALILSLKLLGIRACGMKPIETGCHKTEGGRRKAEGRNEEDILSPSDGMFLREIAQTEESLDLITPVRFENPLAPMAATEIEGKAVDLGEIKRAFDVLSAKYDAVIVEGIGGLLVPIGKDYFVLNLAKTLGLPLIVVAKPGLGTLNHTMLTVNYAVKEGLNVAGIIINYHRPSEDTIAEETNPKILRRISPVPVIGVFPYLRDFETGTIEKAIVRNLDLEIIRRYMRN
ncbi:MAG: dethiobiotin synthase [Nitrospirota bacterium]